jgi:hypothetical protein
MIVEKPVGEVTQETKDARHKQIVTGMAGKIEGVSDVVVFTVRAMPDGNPIVELEGASSVRSLILIAGTAVRTVGMMAENDEELSPVNRARLRDWSEQLAQNLEKLAGYDNAQEVGSA